MMVLLKVVPVRRSGVVACVGSVSVPSLFFTVRA